MIRRLLAISLATALCLVGFSAALAADPGRPILDQATSAASSAEGPEEWKKVVELCRDADRAGLTGDDKKLCNQLLGDALVRRGEFQVDAAREAAVLGRGNTDVLDRVRVGALADLEEAAAIDAGRWRAHWLIAQLHLLPGGDAERAQEALSDALKAAGDDKKLQSRTMALRAQIQETVEKKREDYAKAIELDPKNADAYRGQAVLDVLEQKLDDAAEHLKKAVEADPRHVRTQEAYAESLAELGRSDDAIASLDEALKLMPNVPSLYLAKSQVLAKVRRYDDARKAIEKILELRPNNPIALLAKAEIERRDGKLDAALEDVKKVQAIDPTSNAAALMQTEVLMELKKPDSALEALQAFIVKHAAGDDQMWTRLGLMAMSEKKYEVGVEAFNRSLEIKPNEVLALRTRGDCYISMGRHRDAMKDYEEVLKFAPRESGTLNNIAWLLCTSTQDSVRDGKRALEYAKTAAEETNYDTPHILSTLAAAYAETGDFEKALDWINKALAKVGDDPVRASLENEKKHYVEKKPFREESPAPEVQPDAIEKKIDEAKKEIENLDSDQRDIKRKTTEEPTDEKPAGVRGE
ncbi:MAG TPA: tetratricopeptide repeat protein [Pirellulales bacterium]